MKFDNKIIVSDIDGTFIDRNMQIVDRNIDAVNYFKENGGLFTFATGRSELILEPEVLKIANAPIICCNGSYIYDHETGKRHNEICIAPGPAISLINTVLESFPEVFANITVDKKYYIIGPGEKFNKDLFNLTDDDVIRTTLDKVPTNMWYTVTFYGESEKLKLVEKYLNVAGDGMYRIAASWGTMLEVNNIRAAKGLAAIELKHMCEARYKSSEYTLYGIGDYGNDEDLLRAADVSACPENALDSLKELADVVVCSNNDGALAGFIEFIDAGM